MERVSAFNPNVEPLRKVFARNAKAILGQQEIRRPKLVSGKRISDGTADRVLNAENGQNVTLDTLEKWAARLNAPAWQLLHPDFDVTNPLIVASVSEMEAEVVRRVKAALEPFIKMYGEKVDEQESTRPDGRSPAKPFGNLQAPKGKPSDDRADDDQTAGKAKTRKRQT